MEKIGRLGIALSVMLIGVAGALTVLGSAIIACFRADPFGEVWNFLWYSGLWKYIVMFAAVYLLGLVLWLRFSRPHA